MVGSGQRDSSPLVSLFLLGENASYLETLLMGIVSLSTHSQCTVVCGVYVVPSDPSESIDESLLKEGPSSLFAPRTIVLPMLCQQRYMLMVWVLGNYNNDEPSIMFFDSKKHHGEEDAFPLEGIYTAMAALQKLLPSIQGMQESLAQIMEMDEVIEKQWDNDATDMNESMSLVATMAACIYNQMPEHMDTQDTTHIRK